VKIISAQGKRYPAGGLGVEALLYTRECLFKIVLATSGKG